MGRTAGGQSVKVTVHIVELGFCSDFKHEDKRRQKQDHYGPLQQELERAGWRVCREVHVITVGVRATVPEGNKAVMEGLGIREKKRREHLQEELVAISTTHAARIIAQYRKVSGTRARKHKARTGVG